LGSEIQLVVSAGEHGLVARVDPRTRARVSEEIELVLNMYKIHFFEKEPPSARVKMEERS